MIQPVARHRNPHMPMSAESMAITPIADLLILNSRSIVSFDERVDGGAGLDFI